MYKHSPSSEFDRARAWKEAECIIEDVEDVLFNYPVRAGQYTEESEAHSRITDIAESRGWSFAGGGYFALVYVKADLALKIGLKQNDSGYIYAAWCRSNPKLPGALRVHNVVRGSRAYVALMDRCYKIPVTAERSPGLADEMLRLREAIRGIPNGTEVYTSEATAKTIREFFIGIATFDLHSDNMMLDREGSVVMTDPVAHSQSESMPGEFSYLTS